MNSFWYLVLKRRRSTSKGRDRSPKRDLLAIEMTGKREQKVASARACSNGKQEKPTKTSHYYFSVLIRSRAYSTVLRAIRCSSPISGVLDPAGTII
jgi:hypothetical protein